jgi:DNA polymerase V
MSPRGGSRSGAGRKPGSNAYGEATRPIRVPLSLYPELQNLLEHLKSGQRPGGETGQGRGPVRLRTGLRPGCFIPDGTAPPQALPLFASHVQAGFPSPAEDYVDQRLDLNEYLIHHPAATFFVRVQGDSMEGAAIHDGDLLVVDRALEPAHGRIVIAAVNGELTVKRLLLRDGGAWLQPENPAYAALHISEGLDCVIWGVVKHVIHSV